VGGDWEATDKKHSKVANAVLPGLALIFIFGGSLKTRRKKKKKRSAAKSKVGRRKSPTTAATGEPRPATTTTTTRPGQARGNGGSSDEGRLCSVCAKAVKTQLFTPCGHKAACEACADDIMASTGLCPTCGEWSEAIFNLK
jgi:hypothetical protein